MSTERSHMAVIWEDIGTEVEGLVSTIIGYHRHPAIEIEHYHNDGEVPHTHRPVIEWDSTPILIGDLR